MIATTRLPRHLVMLGLSFLLAPGASPGQAGLERSAAASSASDSPPGRACPDSVPVLVSRPLAEDAGIDIGDGLRLAARPDTAGCRARVSGVYELPADPYRLTEERPRVLLHLPHLARMTDRTSEVDRFSVALEPGAAPDSTSAVLEALLPGTRALESVEVATATSTTFRVVQRFHRAIGIITIVAGGVFLACIMVLKVQERRQEVAALRLIGVSRRTLLGWILSEAALIALLGGVLGIGLGRLASWIINTHYRGVYDTSVAFSTLTPGTVGIGLALAVVLGLVAGGIAAGRLLWLDPLEEVGG